MNKIYHFYIVVLSLLILTSCTSKKTSIPKPSDGELEFWITEDVTSHDWSGHDSIYGWFGAFEYLDKRYHSVMDESGVKGARPEYYVSYIVTNYPDYSSKKQAVTSIEITDPNVTIYGLNFNSNPSKIDEKMIALGLKKIEEGLTYVKGNVTFKFLSNQILITALVTNKENIQF